MHLLKEIYFHINNLEFFVISFFIYIGLVASISLFNYIKKFILKKHVKLVTNLTTYHTANSSYVMKYQDWLRQKVTSSVVKI